MRARLCHLGLALNAQLPPFTNRLALVLQFCVTLSYATVSFSGANELRHHLKCAELDGRTVRSSARCLRTLGHAMPAVSRFYNAHRDRALPVALMTIEECEDHRD